MLNPSKVCPFCRELQVVVKLGRFCWCYACNREWDLRKGATMVGEGAALKVKDLIQLLAGFDMELPVHTVYFNSCATAGTVEQLELIKAQYTTRRAGPNDSASDGEIFDAVVIGTKAA